MYRIAVAAAALVIVVAGEARADTIVFEHNGKNDPTNEGWSGTAGSGGSTSVSAVSNDLGAGIDAWSVKDTGTGLGTTYGYGQTPTSAQVSDAGAYGWTLSATLRVLAGSAGVHDSIFVDYIDGTRQWGLSFDLDANGDPVVFAFTGLYSGSTYTLTNAGSTYHTFDLVYDPSAGSADLFVDGSEVMSNYVGGYASATRVAWGAGASNGTGHAHFTNVEWSIEPVPEPGTLALLGLGLAGIALHRRRRR